MKLYAILVATIILFSVQGCKTGANGKASTYSGKIVPAGITSYQYGTHRLENDEEFYALKSEKIDLSEYEGQNVSIKATKVEGYPVDGGPEYLLVLSIE